MHKAFTRTLGTGALLLTLASGAAAETLEYRPSADFGPGDTLGALNYLNPGSALAASRLVKTGRSYALGMVSSPDTPVWGQRRFGLEVVGISLPPVPEPSAHDDRLVSHLGIGTQIDGLGHVGIAGRFYGGLTSAEFFTPTGLTRLGTDQLPPIVTRGVLLNVAAALGVERMAASQAIGVDLLKRCAQRQGLTIGRGDVVLLHTGWMSMMEEDPVQFIERQPGIDLAAARYLAELGVVAVGADTGGLEVSPAQVEGHPYPVHGLLLANYGVYILENIVTRELAAEGAGEFLFVLGQPRLAGAVQAIINPVAIR